MIDKFMTLYFLLKRKLKFVSRMSKVFSIIKFQTLAKTIFFQPYYELCFYIAKLTKSYNNFMTLHQKFRKNISGKK